MIKLRGLADKTLDDMLRDKVWLINNMKKVASAMGVDVTSGKWLWKFRYLKLTPEQQAKGLPADYPELLCKLFETLTEVYIETRKAYHPLKATQDELDLFKQFEEIEQKFKKSNQK